MAIYTVDQGEEALLDLMLAINYSLRLFSNDVTSGLTSAQINALDEGDFTEATFAGYSAKTLTGGAWTTTQDDPSTGTYAAQTFTRSSTGTAETIYGYYVERASDGALMWFEEFTGPLSIELINDSIEIVPTITLDDDQETPVHAKGIMASQSETTADGSYTSSSATDFALSNFVADGTRTYRIHVDSAWNLTGSGQWTANYQVDGVDLGRAGIITGTSGFNDFYMSSATLWTPDTGTYDLTIYLTEVSGTASVELYAASTTPRHFWIEDIGPR